MSGRIPKRVLISKIQLNDKKKSGRWGKPGIILCNGGRSRRAICNYVKKRTHAETKKEKKEDGPLGSNWTYAPDANFRTAVVSEHPTVEVNGEYFKTSTINTITFLDVNGVTYFPKTISDLTGIEGFTALTQLFCYDNLLTSLDVTNNVNLTQLWCYNNSLTSLDVTNNVNLTKLYCNNNSLTSLNVLGVGTALTELAITNNSLTSLDVTQNIALTFLYCDNNSLNTLDVTQNTLLDILYCNDNSLNTLDVTNNVEVARLFCNDNSLNTLDVTQNTLLQTLQCGNNSLTTLNVYFNTALTDLQCYGNNFTGGGTSVIITAFTDTFSGTFQASPQNTTAAGPFCQVADASAVAHFVNNIQPVQNSIPTNVSYFADISGATFFPDPNFYNAIIADIGIGASFATNYIYDASINTITNLDVNGKTISDLTGIEGFTALQNLLCSQNSLTSLDVTQNTTLTQLYCYDNSLTTLDVTNNVNLTQLVCYDNSLTTLDVSNNVNLTALICGDNQLTSLDVSNNVNLTALQCWDNSLTTLDVTNNVNLTQLYCFDNSLNTLDVTQNTLLQTLLCNGNSLTTLDVSACLLTYLRCDDNNFTGGGTSVIITAFTDTFSGTFQAGQMNTGINPSGDFCKVADASAQLHFDASYNTSIPLGTSYFADNGVTYFPDTNFYTALNAILGPGASFATNYIYDASINTITNLDVNGETISDLTGIEGFTALQLLQCYDNSLTSLDVTQNGNLLALYCNDNSLNTLDVTQNTALQFLNCSLNQLETLDVTNNVNLTQLWCYDNSLNTLDVTQNTALTNLFCYDNSLNTLDVTDISGLQFLYCYNNPLNSLNVTQNIALQTLVCRQNSLTTLDVTQNTLLQTLRCYDNSLTSLDVSNNVNLTTLQCYGNNFTGGGTSVIITAFTAAFSGTFKANPQNTTAAGPFCQVVDASAVAHFVNNIQPVQNSIPSGTSYYS